MPNTSLKKNPMPHQDADVRNKNFSEVALGYTVEQAIDEAERCLNCKHKPCVNGCPVMVHIPEFIAKIKGEKANKIWMQTFEQAQAEVGRMSQDEIDDFYRSHVR